MRYWPLTAGGGGILSGSAFPFTASFFLRCRLGIAGQGKRMHMGL